MANKKLFSSQKFAVPETDTFNDAGGKAYEMSAKSALAQISATNCFNGTFYVSANQNLKVATEAALALKEDPLFVAQCAIYSRRENYMKDMPAFLTVLLAHWGETDLFRAVFRAVIDNAKMLRNFLQIARSNVFGKALNCSRQSIRKAVQEWFDTRDNRVLLNAKIGNDPSMRDIIRMTRIKPKDAEQSAMFAYLLGAKIEGNAVRLTTSSKEGEKIISEYLYSSLPRIVREYEDFKKTLEGDPPRVDFRLIDSLDISEEVWKTICKNARLQMTRMNLNTFTRHGVFEDPAIIDMVVERLTDAESILKARQYPYQWLTAWKNVDPKVPAKIANALQDAMEIAVESVPKFDGRIFICVDVSGSMSSPITGRRRGATSKTRCVDVAALFACAILRQNQDAVLIPFDGRVHPVTRQTMNPRDTVMSNATKLAKFGGGSTNCSAAMSHVRTKYGSGDLVIFISDYESWVDSHSVYAWSYNRGTGLMKEWQEFKKSNPHAKLVCIDLTPSSSSQAKAKKDILQVGGWSDQCFDVIAKFLDKGDSPEFWTDEIEKIEIV